MGQDQFLLHVLARLAFAHSWTGYQKFRQYRRKYPTETLKEYQMCESSNHLLSPEAVERAVRLSYAQAMLGAVYSASTGGMFIIGYALKLGAKNVHIGLMSTIPMLAVSTQLVASILVEKGISRRWMTIFGSLANVSGWTLIILLPYVMREASPASRLGALIAVITLVTVFAQISGNARASWIGDLIPPRQRGMFFGRMIMFAGIIGAMFALAEGMFLDRVKHMGIPAFSWLFIFGMAFGLANSALFLPQADVPLRRHESGGSLLALVRETFTNRPLMHLMAWAVLWSMQAIAGPFYATYMLRDLKMPFLGVGLITSASTISMLASSSFWGRIVDCYGSRPVLIACTAFFAPLPLVWIGLNHPSTVYAVIIPLNLLAGAAAGGLSVASSTLMYKITPSPGRSMQFALYSILVTVLVAPMPTIGGRLPDWLGTIGIQADLRCTFYATVLSTAAAVLAARKIREPNSRRAAELVHNLPRHLRRPETLEPVS